MDNPCVTWIGGKDLFAELIGAAFDSWKGGECDVGVLVTALFQLRLLIEMGKGEKGKECGSGEGQEKSDG